MDKGIPDRGRRLSQSTEAGRERFVVGGDGWEPGKRPTLLLQALTEKHSQHTAAPSLSLRKSNASLLLLATSHTDIYNSIVFIFNWFDFREYKNSFCNQLIEKFRKLSHI